MLVVDSAAGSDVALMAQLRGLVLERADGSVTESLVAEGTSITVSDPGEKVLGVKLRRIEAGVFVAMQVALLEGSVSARENGQVLKVTPSALLHRIEFAQPLSTLDGRSRRVLQLSDDQGDGDGQAGDQRGDQGSSAAKVRGWPSLVLANAGPLQLEMRSGQLVWTPRWEVRFGDKATARFDIEISSIDLPSNMALAMVEQMDQQLLNVDFSRRPELLSSLRVGDRLRVVAKIDETRTLYVLAKTGEAYGHGDFIVGVITALEPAGDALTVQRGNKSVEFVVDDETRFVRRRAAGEASITFADLQLQDRVVVFAERTDDSDHPVRARLVMIKSDS